MQINVDDLTDPAVLDLLEEHVRELRAISPPESSHALDLAGLRAPGVGFWVARLDGEVVGCVALKALDARHAELKSMRTAARHARQGVGTALLRHVLEVARASGFERISLETGSQEYFAPARALYSRHGFAVCDPFGDYRPDPSSTLLTRSL